MPIQIDRMDTSVEITAPAPGRGDARPAPAADPAASGVLRDAIARVMTDELERFLRSRGM